MANIDNLNIEISANVNKANASLDLLSGKLNKVASSLSSLNGSGLTTLSYNIERFAKSVSVLNSSSKDANYTKLKNNLGKLSQVNASGLMGVARSLESMSVSVGKLNAISNSAANLTSFVKAINKFGNQSAIKAMDNMPKLANSLNQMMKTLSKAPTVSNNLIAMTNALAKFASTGASGGRVAASLSKSLNVMGNSAHSASKKSFSLASAIGKMYATYWMLFRAFRGIGKSIDYASQIQEVQNVVDNTFGTYIGKLDAIVNNSIKNLGMSELTVKKVASTYQAMGKAMGFGQSEMADMSVSLTKLTADMASFYDVEQKAVAEDLQSIFTGMAKPLRAYGLDLTEATIREWALNNGMNANIKSMSQLEKAQLRYAYVMANTKVAQGDFAKTSNTWANQIRILKEQFVSLGNVIGRTFIAALKPLVSALNAIMSVIIQFATLVSNALGQIFGWKFENPSGGTISSDYEDAAEAAGGMADNTGKAADNAKKLKQQLQGFDELNNITTNQGSGSGGSGGGGGGSNATDQPAWTTTETIFDYFKSNIKDLETLGNTIRDSLINAMESIDWDSIYEGARQFGSGLASFLNGLFSDSNGKTLFGSLGKTIAGSLNTALYFLNSFFTDFDFTQFGKSLSDGINNFFKTFKWDIAADTLNKLVDGIKDSLTGFFKGLSAEDIFGGLKDFFSGLEFDTVLAIIGFVAWKKGFAKVLVANLFSDVSSFATKEKITALLSTQLPNDLGTIGSIAGKAGIVIGTAIVGFEIGKKLYEKVPTVQECSDALVELVGGLFTGEISLGELTKATFNLSLDFIAKGLQLFNKDGQPFTGEDIKNFLTERLGDFGQKNLDIFFSIKGSIGKTANKIIDIVKEFNGKSLKEKIEFAVGLVPDGFKTVSDWLKNVVGGSSIVNKAIGLVQDFKGFKTVSGWLKNIVWGTTPNKEIGLKSAFGTGIKTVAGWIKSVVWGVTPLKEIGLKKNFIGNNGKAYNTVTAWVQSYIGTGSVTVGAKLSNVAQNAVNNAMNKANGGAFYNNAWHNIQQYANGGMPSHGTMFVAGEAGAEVVGHIGGRTEVINESQLASTMYSAVFSAMQAANGNGSQPVQVYLDGKIVFDSTRQYANDYLNRTGRPAFI